MNLILVAVYFLVFSFLISNLSFFKIDGVSRKTLLVLFSIKVIFGFLLIAVYTLYYRQINGADCTLFHNDGVQLFRAVHQSPSDYLRIITGIGSDAPHLQSYFSNTDYWNKIFNYNLYNDNRTIIRINAILNLVSFSDFYVHTLFFTFFSFMGLTALFKAFEPFFKEKKTELLTAIFLIPSVMFWTSGILKESVVSFAVGILIYGALKIINKKFRLRYLAILISGAGLLLLTKFYFLFALAPGLAAYWWVQKSNQKRALIKFIIVHVLFFMLLYSVKFVLPGYFFLDIISYKQHSFINMVQNTGVMGSYISIPYLEPTLISFVKNLIPAFVNTLFRPHLFEAGSILALASAIENTIIIVLLVFFIYFSGCRDALKNSALLFVISFVFILFITCGLVTPVLGALVRYRAPALPFVFIACLFVFDKKRFRGSTLYRIFRGIKKPAKAGFEN